MCEQSGMPLTAPQLEHAIRRNFGGWEDDDLNPLEEFRKEIPLTAPPDLRSISHDVIAIIALSKGFLLIDGIDTHLPSFVLMQRRHILCPDCTHLGLIKASLSTKETTWHG